MHTHTRTPCVLNVSERQLRSLTAWCLPQWNSRVLCGGGQASAAQRLQVRRRLARGKLCTPHARTNCTNSVWHCSLSLPRRGRRGRGGSFCRHAGTRRPRLQTAPSCPGCQEGPQCPHLGHALLLQRILRPARPGVVGSAPMGAAAAGRQRVLHAHCASHDTRHSRWRRAGPAARRPRARGWRPGPAGGAGGRVARWGLGGGRSGPNGGDRALTRRVTRRMAAARRGWDTKARDWVRAMAPGCEGWQARSGEEEQGRERRDKCR